MPREITILLPDSPQEEYFDIQIQGSVKRNIQSYRFELWDLEKDNPGQLSSADFLKHRITAKANKWVVAEIFAEENKKIPILLKQISI